MRNHNQFACQTFSQSVHRQKCHFQWFSVSSLRQFKHYTMLQATVEEGQQIQLSGQTEIQEAGTREKERERESFGLQ